MHLTSHRVCPIPAGRMAQLEAQLQRAQDTGEADRAALQAARGELEVLRSQAAEAEAAEAMHLAHQASCSASGDCMAPSTLCCCTLRDTSLRLLVALVVSVTGRWGCIHMQEGVAGQLAACIPAFLYAAGLSASQTSAHTAAGRV